jgi:hypothetical protein
VTLTFTAPRISRGVRISARGPSGQTLALAVQRISATRWVSSATFLEQGAWTVEARIEKRLAARVTVRVVPAVSTFMPLGAASCAPPSPANPSTHEALGTAATGHLWAIVYGHKDERSATLDGVVGKQTKIIWRIEGSGEARFTAIDPNGRVLPLSATPHRASTWVRPGGEWGSLVALSTPGCWQIHVERGTNAADLWILVRS